VPGIVSKFETLALEAIATVLVRESRDHDARITVDTPFGKSKLQ